MSETGRLFSSGSDQDDKQPLPRNSVNKETGWGHAAALDKTEDFFQICDSEGKGFITRTDMRKLHNELPLTTEELENVFDSLDLDENGYLTLGEFSSGFSNFLQGRRASATEELMTTPSHKDREAPGRSSGDKEQSENEDDEETHFSMLMESLGASNVFEEPSEVRSLWAQLRKDEPHLLSNFEEFLARVTHQIKEARQERKEMESALRRKAVTHDTEICRLYEEMEQQIINEKDRTFVKDSKTLQSRSQDLQQRLRSKEQELEQLFQKQRRLERQCRDLHSEHQVSRLENVKLKMTNEELSRELEHTCQELVLAQEQLDVLQEQASRLQQEREMEMYRITEGLQREKQSLMKQLDLLREMNKHLRDERDITFLKRSNSMKKSSRKQRLNTSSVKYTERKPSVRKEVDKEEVTQRSNRKTPSLRNGLCSSFSTGDDGKPEVDGPSEDVARDSEGVNDGVDVEDAPPDGWPLRRVISIEEDHLPHLLQGDPHLLLHQLSEEEEEAQANLETSSLYPSNASLASADSPPPVRLKKPSKKKWIRGNMPSSAARGQPVGKETLQQGPAERSTASPQRLFKVILVGNSSVGKTALLRRFCDGQFHSSTAATVGIDYSVRTLNLGDSHVALQLWDTAGQERYRSITKQFFRKADGVVVIYDITMEDSFRSVRPWLESILEAVGDPIPVMLLGNKSDKESEREVQTKEADMLAEEANLMFYECSAYTGANVLEAMIHLARVLREQEDRVWVNTVRLVDQPLKKKSCCK
ncbi:EF-hand calcium-binding domain-containing protein 4B [Puntigrus tetrazona]|uniref:EF-hand calcium-binding domain-containing protein 4B n=1 Tax=Puntigrus tetrazona TaxID=1606681 RepID=UPI001C892AD6|nr:EF-hand calcium-binding domain-containing protein 4B [Puntigrus tetrazona]XP_043093875.1 EF-hand calcium-binding domain-containing protein 4B [Puntigrus tetrazona]XP_043093876.1 EF-hand calcium-binding domain-containing protein 4B [Puntigrus tetrazona]